MVSTRPVIPKSSSPFNKPSVTICTKSTNYNWYKRHFHILRFFQFQSKVKIFILHFTFDQFDNLVSLDSKVYNSAKLPFFVNDYKV